jgi:hypothetical protein
MSSSHRRMSRTHFWPNAWAVAQRDETAIGSMTARALQRDTKDSQGRRKPP